MESAFLSGMGQPRKGDASVGKGLRPARTGAAILHSARAEEKAAAAAYAPFEATVCLREPPPLPGTTTRWVTWPALKAFRKRG